MVRERRRHVFRLLEHYLDIEDPGEREAWLENECGGDREVLDEVRRLGGFTDQGAKLLDAMRGQPLRLLPGGESDEPKQTAGQTPGSAGEALERAPPPVPRVPGYDDLRFLGEGGMGRVYRARQIATRREVALKVLRSDIRTRDWKARFVAESRNLAKMDHPGIVRVLDAGETLDGERFVAMEFLDGVPISDYCDRNQLGLSERLRLFLAVCAAVDHAHSRGVVHRDLKPSNVLIVEGHDGPTPKVIDFGLAKSLDPLPDGDESVTRTGVVIGTPEYMSPEQAVHGNLDETTDVYSLGVVLYELLTGLRPFQFQTWPTFLFLLLREDPPPPTRVFSQERPKEGKGPAKMAAPRKELNWILLKALRKDRADRYENAGALADDLKRYLAHDAVEAAPPSLAYRLRKFIRRHERLTGAVLLIAAVVPVALAIAFYVGLEPEEVDLSVVSVDDRRFESERLPGHRERDLDALRKSIGALVEPEQYHRATSILARWDAGPIPLEHTPLEPSDQGRFGVAVNPSGDRLVTLTTRGAVVWSLPDGKMLTGVERWRAPAERCALRFSHDGSRLAVGLESGIRIVPVADDMAPFGDEHEPLPQSERATQIHWNAGDSLLAGVCEGTERRETPTARIWHVARQTLLYEQTGVDALTFRSSSPGRILFAPSGGTLAVHDAAVPASVRRIVQPEVETSFRALAWRTSSDTDAILAATHSGDLFLWPVETTIARKLAADRWGVHDLAFSDYGWFVTLGYTGHIVLWDTETLDKLLTLRKPRRLHVYNSKMSVSKDRLTIACGGDGAIDVWRLRPPVHQWERRVANEVKSIAFAPDSQRFATLHKEWDVNVWDTDTGRQVGRFETNWPESSLPRYADNVGLAFSSEGAQLAYADDAGNVVLWDVDTGASRGRWDTSCPEDCLQSQLCFDTRDRLLLVRHEVPEEPGDYYWIRVFQLEVGKAPEPVQRVRVDGHLPAGSEPIVGDRLYVWLGPKQPAANRRLHLLDIRTGRQKSVRVEGLDSEAVFEGYIYLSPGGRFVVAGGIDDQKRQHQALYRLEDSRLTFIRGLSTKYRCVPGPDDRWFYHGTSGPKSLLLKHADTGEAFLNLSIEGVDLTPLCRISPDGTWFVYGTVQGHIRAFRVEELSATIQSLLRQSP